MDYRPTDTAEKLVALLDNAKKLAMTHQRLTMAADVVKACKLLSESRSFPVPPEMFDALSYAVRGKMKSELSSMFEDVKRTVVATDMNSQDTSSGTSSWEELAKHIRSPAL